MDENEKKSTEGMNSNEEANKLPDEAQAEDTQETADASNEENAADSAAEDAQTAEQDGEESTVGTDNSDGASFEDFMTKQSADDEAKTEDGKTEVDSGDEVNLDSASKKEKKKNKNKGEKHKNKAIIAVIIVLLLAATGCLLYFVISNTTGSKGNFEKTIVSVDGVDSNVGEFVSYYTYYQSYYSYYGQSVTEDQLKQTVLEYMEYNNALYKAATDAGITLSEEDQSSINEQTEYLSQSAEQQSMSSEDLLEQSYGKGYTVEMYNAFVEKQTYIQLYQEKIIKEIEDKYSGDNAKSAVEAEYKSNKKNYDKCDVSYCYLESSATDSKTKADAIVKAVNSGTAFADAVKASLGSVDSIKALSGYGYSEISENFNTTVADWIFAQDTSGNYTGTKGKVTTITEDGVIYIVYVNNAPARDETYPVTAEYIFVKTGTSDIKTADELKLTAKSTAEGIYNEYVKAGSNASAFTSVTSKYENAGNSLISTDTYEGITADGSHDTGVETWLFDKARKVGDCAVVEGTDGYYVLFYESKASQPSWYTTISDTLVSNAKSQWVTDFQASYKDKITVYDDVVTEAIAYINSLTETTTKASSK